MSETRGRLPDGSWYLDDSQDDPAVVRAQLEAGRAADEAPPPLDPALERLVAKWVKR